MSEIDPLGRPPAPLASSSSLASGSLVDREELTPVCEPPIRAPVEPIGHSWWIEPSCPEVDPGITVEIPIDPDAPAAR